MNKSSQINQYADKIKLSKNSSLLTSLFKRMFLKKMKSISYGYLTIIDNNKTLSFGNSNHSLSAKVEILSPEFYVLLGSGGDLGVAEAYIAGYWKSKDLVELLQIVIKNQAFLKELDSGIVKLFKPINYFIHRNRQNTLLGSKKNILAHYDLSNDFYSLWLDPTMTYSSAIFEPEGITLQEASIEKLDRICRKLDIKNEDKIIEIGSGWGSFAIHAAKKYGCQITTTTISDAQYKYVKSLIKKEGLEDKIELLNKDYRNLTGQFDKLVSIEMIEAVGNNFMKNYFNAISKLVKSNGLILIQGITYNDQGFKLYKNNVDFIKKYIFPGSCLISLENIMGIIKNNTDLALVHLEDITMHYAETLYQWRQSFYDSKERVESLGFSKAFINMWEYYFVYCEAGFLERKIGDVQMVFAKSGSRNIKIKF